MLDLAFEEIVQVLHGNKEVISVNILPLTSPPCHNQEAVVWLRRVSTYAIATSLAQNYVFQSESRNEVYVAKLDNTRLKCPLQ